MMRVWLRVLLFALGVFVTAVLPLSAQTERNPESFWYQQDADKRWNFDLILGLEREPDYPGSDDNDSEPSLGFRAIFRGKNGHRYQFSLGEIAGQWDLSDRTALQLVLEYEEGRDNENPALNGFADGRNTLEGELSIARRWGNAYAFATFQPDILGRGKGIVYFAGAGLDKPLRSGWRIGPRVDVSWANSEHMQTEFGVTNAQSMASGYPVYRPGGGLKSVTANVSFEAPLGRRWSIVGVAEAEHYFAKAADSPLIALQGSDVTTEMSLGALFRF